MRRLILLFLLNACFFLAIGQKPPVDTTDFGKSPRIYPQISSDGNYSLDIIEDIRGKTNTLFIVSNQNDWKIRVRNVKLLGTFSANSHFVFFVNANDSLGMVTLGSDRILYTPHIGSFQLSGDEGQEWLAYSDNAVSGELTICNLLTREKRVIPGIDNYSFSKNGKMMFLEKAAKSQPLLKELVVYHLKNKKEMTFNDVITYLFSSDPKRMLLTTASGKDSLQQQRLQWVNLDNGVADTIWQGIRADNYAFDKSGRQLAFISTDAGENNHSIFYYKESMKEAIPLCGDSLYELGYKGFIDNTQLFFNHSGSKLIFQLAKKENSIPPSEVKGSPHVYVWNYKDEFLPGEQMARLSNPIISYQSKIWASVDINANNKQIIPLTKEGEVVQNFENFDKYLFIVKGSISTSKGYLTSLYKVDVTNGGRQIAGAEKNRTIIAMSPGGHFGIWFDQDSLSYFSYEIDTGITRNISQSIPFCEPEALKNGEVLPFDTAGWEARDRYVYIYDQFDIWKIDTLGLSTPKNITNHYGQKNGITFGIAWLSADHLIRENEELLLTGYNNATKANGFWKVRSGAVTDPVEGSMDPYCYYVARIGRLNYAGYAHGLAPIKAKNADKFLVQRMTASEFPNFFFTDDFHSFKRITDVHPEHAYNWLTAELVNWRLPDGQLSQGILYKPENFDSTKRYPLIFDYYQTRSDELHEYIEPGYSWDRINIPYYVSNGYLVFVPDIYYTQGHNGRGVVNSVVSAAKYLAGLSWVDSTRLGLQGHSFGGWETNYLVTHSHCFAAACEAAGVSDQVSAYDQLNYDDGSSRQLFYERESQGSPYGPGVTPWTHPDLYIENSPVFYADKATTPLLMMHGTVDVAVPYPQATEMYLALRRAGKKVWFLEYENGRHSVFGDDSKDYTLRMKQFFDYYLKGAPPPKWMTQGIPASERATNSGLDLDLSGQLP